MPVDDITILDGGDLGYPYRLVNTSEGETVNARLLSR